MTSLAEVYEGGAGGADLRRLYVGVALFLVGAALTVAGIAVGTSTTVAGLLDLGVFGARELAGILAGTGLPATFLGAVIVLPRASRWIRAAAGVGALVALAGVVAFTAVYPSQWYGMPTDYTLPVTALYFAGVITTFWCLFVAVANFKARNDPGGTVRLEVTKEGETKVVEVSSDRLRQGLGGIGLLGTTPDGSVETQTNGPETTTARSDGGAAVTGPSKPPSGETAPGPTSDAEIIADDEPATRGDPYCGNCEHFSYVRTDDDLEPYCGFHGELLDDMEACSKWEPNT